MKCLGSWKVLKRCRVGRTRQLCGVTAEGFAEKESLAEEIEKGNDSMVGKGRESSPGL